MVGALGTVFGPIAGAAEIIALRNDLAGFGEPVQVIQGSTFVATAPQFPRGVDGETGGA